MPDLMCLLGQNHFSLRPLLIYTFIDMYNAVMGQVVCLYFWTKKILSMNPQHVVWGSSELWDYYYV